MNKQLIMPKCDIYRICKNGQPDMRYKMAQTEKYMDKLSGVSNTSLGKLPHKTATEQYNDNKPLNSIQHPADPDFTTRIQIGSKRFYLIEKIINWFYFRFHRPKLSNDNFEYIDLKPNK